MTEHKAYTAMEEVAHALTHGIGAVLSIAALVVMILGPSRMVMLGTCSSQHLWASLILFTRLRRLSRVSWPRIKAFSAA